MQLKFTSFKKNQFYFNCFWFTKIFKLFLFSKQNPGIGSEHGSTREAPKTNHTWKSYTSLQFKFIFFLLECPQKLAFAFTMTLKLELINVLPKPTVFCQFKIRNSISIRCFKLSCFSRVEWNRLSVPDSLSPHRTPGVGVWEIDRYPCLAERPSAIPTQSRPNSDWKTRGQLWAVPGNSFPLP